MATKETKLFNVSGWLVILFILAVGALAIAYIDLRMDLTGVMSTTSTPAPVQDYTR